MSSYDCVLPIEEERLRAHVLPSSEGEWLELPVLAESLRGRDHDDDSADRFRAILQDAAEVAPVTDDAFYGRLHSTPAVAVAGTKNGFRLAGLERTWVPERSLYRCRWTQPVPGAELLDQLLHGLRGVPGLRVLPEAPAWPAFDDPMVMGYLMAAEVRQLDRIAQAVGPEPHEQWLRAMIARAAEATLALVTLQDGLI